jgi:cytochrome P450
VQAAIRDHPAAIENISMELMRYVSMSTALVRVVKEDFDWQGREFRKGQLVYLVIAAANRDPQVFADPEKLDVSRPQGPNMTFAPGAHHCIGHFFAKMQLAEFFPELLRRFERIEILDETLDWHSAIGFRGLRHLHLRLWPSSAMNCGVVNSATDE